VPAQAQAQAQAQASGGDGGDGGDVGALADRQQLGIVDVDFEDLAEEELIAQQITRTAELAVRLDRHCDDEAAVVEACAQLAGIFEETPLMMDQFVGHASIVPIIMDLLDAEGETTLVAVLKLLNIIVAAASDPSTVSEPVAAFSENLCLVGVFPVVFTFAIKEEMYSAELRLQTASFVEHMCNASMLTLQMFISCGGLPALVHFLDVDLDLRELPDAEHPVVVVGAGGEGEGAVGEVAMARSNEQHSATTLDEATVEILHIAIDSVVSIFNLQSITIAQNDFCHFFANVGLLRRLTAIFTCFRLPRVRAAHGEEAIVERMQQIGDILVIFSCGDHVCKEHVCEDTVLASVMRTLTEHHERESETSAGANLSEESNALLVTKMLVGISNLATEAGTLDKLEAAGAIPTLISYLSHHGGTHAKLWHHHAVHALFYLCRINKRRQEQAARAGLVAPLMEIASRKSPAAAVASGGSGTSSASGGGTGTGSSKAYEEADPLKQLVLPLLCDLAHASSVTRAQLWAHSGVQFFLDLLHEAYWGTEALSALHVWLVNDLDNVETILLRPASMRKLVVLVQSAQQEDFANLLEPLLDMLAKSMRLNQAFGRSGLFLAEVLARLNTTAASALVRKNLLRIVQVLFDFHPRPVAMILQHGLIPVLEGLAADDSMVLVAELADQLLRKCTKVIEATLLEVSPEFDDDGGYDAWRAEVRECREEEEEEEEEQGKDDAWHVSVTQ